jgi:hypothetical protein
MAARHPRPAPDYDDQTYDLMILIEGDWPSEGQLAIERLSSQYFGPEIGDSVILQIRGEEETLKLTD